MCNFQISYLRYQCQISYNWKYISCLGPNFSGMRDRYLLYVEYVLIGCNFDFFDGYFGRYCLLPSRYCSLPGGYCSFPLLV